jgi:hypothetical protein
VAYVRILQTALNAGHCHLFPCLYFFRMKLVATEPVGPRNV